METKALGEKQKSRIYYLDFVRGLAIFFMVMQHTMIMHEKTGGEVNTLLGGIFILLGTAPAAPVFMLIMGAFIMKSNKTMKEGIVRGIRLFIFGYVLNVFRFTIPLLISGTSPFLGKESLSLLFEVDIFQLAGLSLIAASLIRRFASNRYVYPILILLILFISPYLWGHYSSIPLFTPFWGIESFVSFPFFPWVIYPLLGMYLSKYILDKTLIETMWIKFFVFGLIILTVGILLFNKFPTGDYYRSGLGVHLTIIGFVFLWLLISYQFVEKSGLSKQNFILRLLVFWSKNVSVIYIIQWILFGWSILLLDVNQQQDYIAMLIGFIVLFMTHMLVKYTPVSKLQSWL